MDISSIAPTVNELKILHPSTAESIGLTIRIQPITSPAVREVQRRITNETLRTKGRGMTAEKMDAHRLDILVAATAGWSWEGDATWNGEKPEATPAAIRKVYKDAPWIKEQVDAALNDEAAFFRGDK
jgi:hypothetical protein